MLEDQMRQKRVSLWQEVLEAEKALDEGDVDALGWFIEAAGTMIDNHRMAKHMFGRHRVSLRVSTPPSSLRNHQSIPITSLFLQ
jgi:hypothetical protein